MVSYRSFIWFFCGISLLSILLGFLTGASSSPVAGVAITSVFGLVATVFGLYHKISIEKKLELVTLPVETDGVSENQSAYSSAIQNYENLETSIHSSLNRSGQLLIIFTIMFCVGLGLGINLRIGDWLKQPIKIKQFPWINSTAPTQTENAVDWLIVQENLLRFGYSEKQVEELYKIEYALSKKRGSERSLVSNSFTGNYDGALSLLFSSIKEINKDSENKEKAITAQPNKLYDNDS
jgi:hypothetical protein